MKSPFSVNVPEAMSIAVEEGMGIGVFPAMSAIDGIRSGRLIRVLPHYTVHPFSIYVRYRYRRYLDAKIRTWLDLLQTALPLLLVVDTEVLDPDRCALHVA